MRVRNIVLGTELHSYDLGQRLLEKSRRGFLWFPGRRSTKICRSGEFPQLLFCVCLFFCSLNALSPSPMGFNNKPQALAFAPSHCLTWRAPYLEFDHLPNAFCAVSCHQETEGNIMQLEDFLSSSFQPETDGPERRLLPLGRNCGSSLAELQLSAWIWPWTSFLFKLLSFCCFVCLLRQKLSYQNS